jgi:hypothetical protein
MGGRGSISRITNQINMQDIVNKDEIDQIKIRSDELRLGNPLVMGVSDKSGLRQCRCCECYSIPANSTNYECEICGWIDNEHQNNNIDSLDGPNNITLREAKHKWNLRNM